MSRQLPQTYFDCVPKENQWKLKKSLDFDSGGVETHLGEITKVIDEWEGDVATALELTPVDVEAIKTKYPGELKLQTRAALRNWKTKFGINATYGNLIKVFVTAGKASYAEAVSRVLGAFAHPQILSSSETHKHQCTNRNFDPAGRTVETYMSQIINEVKDPVKLAEQLYSAKLISQSTYKDVRDTNVYEEWDTKAIMLNAVKDSVTVPSNHHKFNTFLKVLTEALHSTTIAKSMEEDFQLELKKKQGQCRNQKSEIHQRFDHSIPPGKKLKTECHTAMSQCISYLKYYYKKKSRPMAMKYPFKAPTEYINLALIRREHLSKYEIDNIMSSSIHGNIDDILDATSKSSITMEQVAMPNEDGSLPSFILVMGAPGVGKSTFAWELTQQWAVSSMLQDYSVVLLLRARDRRVLEATNLEQLLYFNAVKPAIEDIERSHGSGILLILDGYDEIPNDKRGFIDTLLRGEILPGATLLVTSRPSARDHILLQCHDMSQHIEILGFTKQNIWSYAKSEMKSNDLMLQSFERYLSCYPNIHSAMYIPLNCTFVVQIYKENWRENEDTVVFKTMTELYTSLIRSHLLRHINECQSEDQTQPKKCRKLGSIENLQNFNKFLVLCEFACNSMLENKVVFSEDELPPDLEDFSMMQTEQELYVDEGYSKSHNFLHLTMQEYLTAYFISRQSEELQQEFVKAHVHSKKFTVVMKFVAGLTKFQAFDESCLRELIAPKESAKRTISVDCLHMLFEVQESTTVKNILIEKIVFRHIGLPVLTPYDYHVLGFCIANSRAMWDLRLLTELSQESGTLFCLGAQSNRGQLSSASVDTKHESVAGACTALNVQGYQLTPSALQPVLQSRVCELLTSLTLRNTGLNSEACDNLSSCLCNLGKLEVLVLAGNSNLFLKGGEKQLVYSLLKSNSIKTLVLESTGLGDGKAISDLLMSCKALSCLDCDANDLTLQQAKLILMALQENRTVTTIGLSTADLSSDNGKLLADVLRCNWLEKLYISECNIDSVGAIQIAEALSVNKSLFLLHMNNNNIRETGATSFSKMLMKNKTLTKLMLSDVTMGADGAKHLVDSLVHNHTLEILELSKNFHHLAESAPATSKQRILWMYDDYSFSEAPE